MKEPDWKSSRHIGKMILLATAAAFFPNLVKSYPYYYEKHRSYLSDIYPEYFRVEKSVDQTGKKKTSETSQPRLILSLPENNFQVENVLFQEIANCFSTKLSTEECNQVDFF